MVALSASGHERQAFSSLVLWTSSQFDSISSSSCRCCSRWSCWYCSSSSSSWSVSLCVWVCVCVRACIHFSTSPTSIPFSRSLSFPLFSLFLPLSGPFPSFPLSNSRVASFHFHHFSFLLLPTLFVPSLYCLFACVHGSKPFPFSIPPSLFPRSRSSMPGAMILQSLNTIVIIIFYYYDRILIVRERISRYLPSPIPLFLLRLRLPLLVVYM